MSAGTYLGITFAFGVVVFGAWLVWRADKTGTRTRSRAERRRGLRGMEGSAMVITPTSTGLRAWLGRKLDELRQRWASRNTAIEIPREGPMRGPWERAVDRFDWAVGGLLAAWLLNAVLRAMLRG